MEINVDYLWKRKPKWKKLCNWDSGVCLSADYEATFISDSITNNNTCAVTALKINIPPEQNWLERKGTPLYFFFFSLILAPIAHYTAGLDVNDTYSGKGEPFSGDHSADRFEVTSRSEISSASETPPGGELSSTIDYDYAEEYDNEPQISGYIVDDSVRGE